MGAKMENKKFSEVQLQILGNNSTNQLVSAGAGSGKTTVMIQKIADLIIESKVPVESMLVVTFTVLAAQEMKARLIEELNKKLKSSTDKQHILDVIDQVNQANIDTIDGFSSKTIKKFFYELNISPNIEIITDATRDYYLTRAMKQTMDDFSTDEYGVNMMLDIFGGNARNFDALEQLILDRYNNIINIENYDEFLQNAQNEYAAGSKSEKIVNDYVVNTIENYKKILQDDFSNQDDKIKPALVEFIGRLNTVGGTGLKENLTVLYSLDFSIFNRKLKGDCKDAMDKIKDLKKSLLKKNRIGVNFEENYTRIDEYFSKFVCLLQNFIKNYNNLKQNNNLVDFNDLNRLMLKLLKNPLIKAQLNNQFKYVFVDEYQDINPLQDTLINALVGTDCLLFTVGDVKQSIYGFRGASPEWFLDKYNSYRKDSGRGYAYNMNENYRSNPKILTFINEVFNNLMTESSANLNYKLDGTLKPKRDDIVDDKVKILLAPETEDVKAGGIYSVKQASNQPIIVSGEAMLVANTIFELVGTEFYDANLKQKRALNFSDFAILSRSVDDKKVNELVRVLKSTEIPIRTSTKLQIDSEGIKLILSILKCINNTADNVDLLAFYLALTPLSIDELTLIHKREQTFKQTIEQNAQNPSILFGQNLLSQLKAEVLTNTNSGLIRYILNDAKLRYYLYTKPYGEATVMLIEEFINKISALEDGLNLTEFIKVVESNLTRFSEVETEDGENSVTIQTIHKSKGLEYPVVILFNTGKQFNYITDNEIVNFNADLGLGVDFYDSINRTKCSSIPHFAIKILNNLKGYKEEMRLLYVALTRAKNKLIITGSFHQKNLGNPLANNNFLNMILNQIGDFNLGETEKENCIIKFEDNIKLHAPVVEAEKTIVRTDNNFVYPNQQKFSLPLKNTVTGLNSEYSQKDHFATRVWLTPAVQYNDDEDRALIGTHYHQALEELDYLKPYSQTTNFADVDYNKIRLAHSKISSICSGAVAIHKEAEFMMYQPYNKIVNPKNIENLPQNDEKSVKNGEILQNDENFNENLNNTSQITDKILIQGVVDLIIEFEDSITIVDYKFSGLGIDELLQKYAEQLNLYKMAVEDAFHKPVEHMYIYSINTGELG